MLWSYILTLVGITGFWLAGRKVWWCWYVNIANQVLWLAYALITGQWGFIIGTAFYTVIFARNAYRWTVDRKTAEKIHVYDPIGRVESVSIDGEGNLSVSAKLDDMSILFDQGNVIGMSIDMSTGVSDEDRVWVTSR